MSDLFHLSLVIEKHKEDGPLKRFEALLGVNRTNVSYEWNRQNCKVLNKTELWLHTRDLIPVSHKQYFPYFSSFIHSLQATESFTSLGTNDNMHQIFIHYQIPILQLIPAIFLLIAESTKHVFFWFSVLIFTSSSCENDILRLENTFPLLDRHYRTLLKPLASLFMAYSISQHCSILFLSCRWLILLLLLLWL